MHSDQSSAGNCTPSYICLTVSMSLQVTRSLFDALCSPVPCVCHECYSICSQCSVCLLCAHRSPGWSTPTPAVSFTGTSRWGDVGSKSSCLRASRDRVWVSGCLGVHSACWAPVLRARAQHTHCILHDLEPWLWLKTVCIVYSVGTMSRGAYDGQVVFMIHKVGKLSHMR